MSEFNLIKCPQFLDNAITPPAKEIGNTLGNIFYAIFSPINYSVEKLKIKQSENLKKYESDIQSELTKIPEDKLIEPNLSVVGPALDASKYYIEDSELRRMFAKLIASSMNSDTTSTAHPAFVEIIKQLTPLDASNLSFISSSLNTSLPIAEYQLVKANGNQVTIQTNVFLSNKSNLNIYEQAASITNLYRLGLINVEYDRWISDLNLYSIFKTHNLFLDYSRKVASGTIVGFEKVDIQKGTISSTPFGKNFFKICL